MRAKLEQARTTLGVASGASPSEVRDAYRSLVRAHHRAFGADVSPKATERLAELNAAKDLIDRTSIASTGSTRNHPRPTQHTETSRDSADIRTRREAEARALRKAKEADANAKAASDRHMRNAVENMTRNGRSDAELDAMEEMRRRRRAAFSAAISGGRTADAARESLLGRLFAVGTRTIRT